jgi:hypothetical protein
VFAPADANPQGSSRIPKAISRDTARKFRRIWQRPAAKKQARRLSEQGAVGGNSGVDRQPFDQLDGFEALPG